MPDTNSTLSIAKKVIWEKAVIRSNHDDRGKSPEELDFSKEKLSHLDVGSEEGKLMVKAFYYGARKCFYLDIPENQYEHWTKAVFELYSINPFGNKNEIKKKGTVNGW